MTTTKKEFSRGQLVTVFKVGDAKHLLNGRIRWALADGLFLVEVFGAPIPLKYRTTELVDATIDGFEDEAGMPLSMFEDEIGRGLDEFEDESGRIL